MMFCDIKTPTSIRRMGVAAVLAVVLVWSRDAVAADRHPYTFQQEGQHYTFTSEFVVAASPDQVLDILYPVPDLRQYSSGEGSVDLIDEGSGWQVVRLTHATLLWTFSAVVRREIACAGQCIVFHMLHSTRTGFPIPMPIASDGEYLVESAGNGTRVKFTQSVEAPDTILLSPWMAWAKSHAVAFSHDLESYVRSKLH